MRTLFAVCAIGLAAGCSVQERPPDLAGGGGVGGGGGGGGGDGDAGSDAVAAQISGSVCLLGDVRLPTGCIAGAIGGLDVAVTGATGSVLTSGTGAFSIDAPGTSTATLEIGFGEIAFQDTLFTVALSGGASGVSVPIVSALDWATLLADLGTTEPSGTATLAIYIRRGGAPVIGAEVISNTAAFAPFYDAGPPNRWSQDGLTAEAGASLLFAVPADVPTAEVTVIDPLGGSVDVTKIPVTDGAITFVTVALAE